MKSLHVNFKEADRTITPIENAETEPWDGVCEKFDNDVHRIMSVSDQDEFTALYACYDENNRPVYYLVEEDEALMKLRRKTFLSKLGQLKP
jgi:hypothetical protein